MRGFWGVAEMDYGIESSFFVRVLRGVVGIGVG
jgi:hypothetical protein